MSWRADCTVSTRCVASLTSQVSTCKSRLCATTQYDVFIPVAHEASTKSVSTRQASIFCIRKKVLIPSVLSAAVLARHNSAHHLNPMRIFATSCRVKKRQDHVSHTKILTALSRVCPTKDHRHAYRPRRAPPHGDVPRLSGRSCLRFLCPRSASMTMHSFDELLHRHWRSATPVKFVAYLGRPVPHLNRVQGLHGKLQVACSVTAG